MANNNILLEACINKFKEENISDLPSSFLFEFFSIAQVLKNTNLSYENILDSIVDGSLDGGIDSFIIIINGDYFDDSIEISELNLNENTKVQVIINQCKKESSFKEDPINRLQSSMNLILDLNTPEKDLIFRFNQDLNMKIKSFRDIWLKTFTSGGSISLAYNYITIAPNKNINQSTKSKVEQLINASKDKIRNNSLVSFFFIDSEDLLTKYNERRTNRSILTFKDRPLSVYFNDNKDKGYVGTIKLSDYKNFITNEENLIKEELFDSNIRHFQGDTVNVNKTIKETIINNKTTDFWWMNNGITIIAKNPKEANRDLSLEDIQIVNGLQTSYSIFNSYSDSNNDERSLLVKVIITSDPDTIANIIASTNRQNPVNKILLKATDPIQIKLELFFSSKNYFYDRRKNYYKNMGKPASKIYNAQDVAQSVEALIFSSPHAARRSVVNLFSSDTIYNRIFNEQTNFLVYLNCCKLYRKCHYVWLKITDSRLKNKTTNFKFHLLCVLYRLYKYEKGNDCINLDKNSIIQDIIHINETEFTQEMFNNSIQFLAQSIDSFLKENKDKDIVNIAKAQEFTTFLFNDIKNKVQTSH